MHLLHICPPPSQLKTRCPQVARAKNQEAAIRAETDTKVGEAKTLLTANLAKQKKEVNGMIDCAAGE